MKQKILLVVLFALNACFIFADPAPRDSFMITQQDGTMLWIYERGDEYFHWEETTDGYIITPNAQGVMEYASANENKIEASGVKVNNTKSVVEKNFARQKAPATRAILKTILAEHREQRMEHQNRITIPTSSVVGTRRILTVLVGFSNYPFTYNAANFDSIMNYVGYTGHRNAGSVKDYYLENSFNQLTLQSTVIGPFIAAHDTSYYSRPKGGNLGGHSRELVREAIEYAKTQDIDFSAFDGNNDGIVDCIHIVYAGNRYQTGGPGFIWPYHSNYDTTFVQNGKQITIADFIMTPEKLDRTYSSITSIGTICHEIGHVLGAPDFYPIGNYSSYEDQLGTGIWDVMAAGSQAFMIGAYPTYHNPYTKTAIFKWTNPITIDSTEINSTYSIPASSTNANAIYKIPTTTEGEYYLLENRQKTSFDRYLPDSGLLIYHIHSDIEHAIANNTVNSHLQQKCYLVNPAATLALPDTTNIESYGAPALNVFPENHIEGLTNIFFSSQTNPRSQSWEGEPTGVDVCFIQHDGNNMKFVVNPQIEGPYVLPDSAWYYLRNVPSGATITWSLHNYSTVPKHCVIAQGQGTDSVYIALRPTGAMPPPIFPSLDSEQPEGAGLARPYAKLSVTISAGTQTYTASKNLNRPSSLLYKPAITNSVTYTLELWHSIYGLRRTQEIQNTDEPIDTNGLPQGIYIVLKKNNSGEVVERTKIIILNK